ncbi:MAG: hypothetical protein NVS3B25_31460 [Hymenobacter sp.]
MTVPLFSNPATTAPFIIDGAGRPGLTAAGVRHAAGVPVRVLEARDRVGGRTLVVPARSGSPEAEGVDLGATWGWHHHPHLMRLLDELAMTPFVQPSAGATTYETPDAVHRLPQPGTCAWPAGRLPCAGS